MWRHASGVGADSGRVGWVSIFNQSKLADPAAPIASSFVAASQRLQPGFRKIPRSEPQLFQSIFRLESEMSLFNLGTFHHSGEPVTSGKCEWDRRWPHNPETGRSTEFDSPGQRKSFLARNPKVDAASLPPVRDPNASLPWDDSSTIDGLPANLTMKYARLTAEAALLKDPVAPVQRREPTKPVAKPAISLYRSSIHECGHVLACFVFDVPVARMSLIKDGDRLGHIKHANLRTAKGISQFCWVGVQPKLLSSEMSAPLDARPTCRTPGLWPSGWLGMGPKD